MTETLRKIDINTLMPDPSQPRKSFLKEEIDRLAASIDARGLLQPLRVRWDDDRQMWRIVTGECRWRAARIAGLKEIPCISVDGEISETDLLADQIIENSVRNDLRPIELARALAKLKALRGCTAQQLAKELGLSGAAISRSEALLSLPDTIAAMLDEGRVPESAAYEISRLQDPQAQLGLAHAIAEGRVSRDQIAQQVQSRVGKRHVLPKAGRVSFKLESGVAITVTAGQPLSWDVLLPALDSLRRRAKKLSDDGQEVAALSRPVPTS